MSLSAHKRRFSWALLLIATTAGSVDQLPSVAGSFYPADAVRLARTVDELFAAASPPRVKGDLLGLLVPHAGYTFSGPVAALGFKVMPTKTRTVVILATGHWQAIRGAALISEGHYATPLGSVEIDSALTKALLSKSALFESMPSAFSKEHSVEVELPFLQRRLGSFRVVPILMNSSDPEVCGQIGRALGEVIADQKALLVISSDLSHYPPVAVARVIDSSSLSALRQLRPDFFWRACSLLLARHEKNVECIYCGQAALMAGLVALEKLGANDSHLLKYTTSGDLPQNATPDRVVGYAAVAFTKVPTPPAQEIELPGGLRRELLDQARTALADAAARRLYQPVALSKSPALNLPAALFVTLMRAGTLRGCVGTTEPVQTLLEATRAITRAAAREDARFPPVRPEEVDQLKIEISILTPLRDISGPADVHEGDGVAIEKDGHRGLFLPEVWKELPQRKKFFEELCHQKAGLPANCADDKAVRRKVFSTFVVNE